MNEITITEKEQEFALMQRMGKAFFASGMFADLKLEAQAIVKVMVGKELGLSPFASINGIHMVMGKPTLGANLMATMIANHPTYNYRILKATNEICEIEFYESKNKIANKNTAVGTVSFTIKEATEAGLLAKKDSIWLKYPSDMLFARAISRGARRFAPGIFGGAVVYTPEEMGVDTDEDGVIEMPKTIDVKVVDEVREAPKERDGIIPKKSTSTPLPTFNMEEKQRELDVIVNAIRPPLPDSDEAIIEEIKKTHVISEGGF